MNSIYLERRDPEKNLSRFYAMTVTRTIFGDWAVIREWGRIGSPGTVREDWFDTEDAAQAAKRAIFRRKEKKGYFNPDSV